MYGRGKKIKASRPAYSYSLNLIFSRLLRPAARCSLRVVDFYLHLNKADALVTCAKCPFVFSSCSSTVVDLTTTSRKIKVKINRRQENEKRRRKKRLVLVNLQFFTFFSHFHDFHNLPTRVFIFI